MDIGVFGGSFDPPHLGHLAAAQDAQERLELDRVLFVPARVSPFKTSKPGTDPDLRLRMLRAALGDHPDFGVWEGELERDPPSFTVDTLEELRAEVPGAGLTLLMGEDQWASFQEWRDPDRIARLARLVVLERAGTPGRTDDEGGDRWECVRVPVRRMDISSTEIRERVRGKRSIRYLVPESVRDLILKNELYRATVTDAVARHH